jgi:hypothetical protein
MDILADYNAKQDQGKKICCTNLLQAYVGAEAKGDIHMGIREEGWS